MSFTVERITERIREVDEELTRDVREQQRRWHYRMHRGRAWFDQEVRDGYRLLRTAVNWPLCVDGCDATGSALVA